MYLNFLYFIYLEHIKEVFGGYYEVGASLDIRNKMSNVFRYYTIIKQL